MERIGTDVLIIGGSLGGCAAAISVCRAGLSACLVEETRWIGGQVTSQGVSALDEHEYIEKFGCSLTYYEFRNKIREYYRQKLNESSPARQNPEFSPGNCWVSRLSFEPKAGLWVLNEMLSPYLRMGQLKIYTLYKPVFVERSDDRISTVTFINEKTGEKFQVEAEYFIDATELGDILSLSKIRYVVGAESTKETDEPHALDGPNDPSIVQSFTYTFAVEYRPGESNLVKKPEGYEYFRDNQPYSLEVDYGDREIKYGMFKVLEGTFGSFWTYRRLIDSSQFRDDCYRFDISLINWPSNDFHERSIIDTSEEDRLKVLKKAKNLSLGFLYWLQTEAPRDDGGKGYPELKLRKDVMGTADGLSTFPYVRESRRIRALKTIREQDISAEFQKRARSRIFFDSVGIGKYWIDVHNHDKKKISLLIDTKPFQIPLGALIPEDVDNLIAGSKNIGTTHITNGAYRVHHVEWSIGEAAGALAAFCVENRVKPKTVFSSDKLRQRFQIDLLERGVPLFWFIDVPISSGCFVASQIGAILKIVDWDENSLYFCPNRPVRTLEAFTWIKRLSNFLSLNLERLENTNELLNNKSLTKILGKTFNEITIGRIRTCFPELFIEEDVLIERGQLVRVLYEVLRFLYFENGG